MSETGTKVPWHKVLAKAMYLVDHPGITSVNQVLYEFPELTWDESEPGPGGMGKIAYAVLERNPETREIHVLVALENAVAPEHIHGGTQPAMPYGELIIVLAGTMDDMGDDEKPVRLTAGMHFAHGPDTRHQPRTDSFCLVYYHQPR